MIGGILFGAVIGGIAGLLLAPQTGRENREALQERLAQVRNRVRRNNQQGVEELPERQASRDADYLH